MTRIRGAMIGLIATPAAVSAVGAGLGFVNGWAPCQGVPFSLYGAGFGALAHAPRFFALPAAILGGAVGAAFSRGLRGMSIGVLMLVIAALALALALTVPLFVHAAGLERAPASTV